MPTLRRARGLYTYDSEINRPEGALNKADNIIIDEDDVIEPRRGFAEYGDSFGSTSDKLSQLLFYKGRMIRHFNSTLQFDSNGSGTFSNFSGSYISPSDYRINNQESKGNLYFTTDSGVKRISSTSSSQFSTGSDYIKTAGVPKAVDLDGTVTFDSSGFLLPESNVAYRVLWGIRDTNNNLLFSTPSSRVVVANTSADVNISESFSIDLTGETETTLINGGANSYVLFSSDNIDYFGWWSNTANSTEPSTSDTIGRTSIEIDIDGLGATLSDIVSKTANVLGGILTSTFTVTINTNNIVLTSLESPADLTDASVGVGTFSVTIDSQGEVISGKNANVNLTFTIPEEVNSTDFFYRIFRTSIITANSGINLSLLDPGDEMNLVEELNITSAELTAKEVNITDITPESFRQSGVFLYTNPNTGQGILQSNSRPPVANDITLFRNTMFYANTRTAHKKELSLLSVTGFTTDTSEFIIGNSSITRTYTFVGKQEITDVQVSSWADGDYFIAYSANDTNKYAIWLDENNTGSSEPVVSDAILVRIGTLTADTDNQVAAKLNTIVNLLDDFNSTVLTDTVTITTSANGNTTDASVGTWIGTISVTTQGDGEDSTTNEVLLSNSASAGTAIDETARSLVKIINKDTSSPVYAFYISGPNDLPGNILLENRNLSDNPFYLSVNDAAIDDKFNPIMPLLETITTISVASSTQITSAGHDLSTGDNVYIYNTDSTPAILGKYSVTVVDMDNFTIPVTTTGSGTTGNWYLTTVTSDNEISPNRVYYSKNSQPEAVPSLNFLDIGPKDDPIRRIIALRDTLLVFKERGSYLITGTTAPNFEDQLLDLSIQIIAPDSARVLNNKVYMLSSQGVVEISEGGSTRLISRPIENLISSFANSRFPLYDQLTFGISYESDRAFFLWAPTKISDTVATQCFRYNTLTKTWTRWTKSSVCGAVNIEDDKLYLGSGDRNYSDIERKTETRADYADRDFTLSYPPDPIVDETTYKLSNVSDMDNGDVLYQTQYVTLSIYNRLLQKLDIDSGLDDTDYFSTLLGISGNDMATLLNILNIKLVADDSSGTITSTTFSGDITSLQTDYNIMIGELNNLASDAIFDNYKQATNLIAYETIALSIDSSKNRVTIAYSIPILQGTVTVFKGFECAIEWAPQHFGAPEVLKQVREGTIIFDQNNFYSAVTSYASDVNLDFTPIPFRGRGSGYWGFPDWGNFVWGGKGNDVPHRTLVPRDKQRCRYIFVKFNHINAREKFKIVGISLEPRSISSRAYRSL